MKSFVLTNEAKNDLKQIARFTEKRWGKEQRNLYIKQFDDVFFMISETPLAGKPCDYIKAGYRKLPQGSHIIFYKIGHNSIIEIIRILHKSIDVSMRFNFK